MCSLWGFALLEINSYLSKKKKIFNQIPAVKWQPKNKWFLSSTLARQNTQDTMVVSPPLEKFILSSQSLLDGQPNNKGMSPDSLWKPDSVVPIYNWHSRSKMIPCGSNGECLGRIKRPKIGILRRDIKMIIRTTILHGNKVC